METATRPIGHRSPVARRLLLAAVALAVVAAPVAAAAQCAFDRPNGSTSYSGNFVGTLVRAFVSCNNPGGNTPNSTGAGGVPSCAPVENYNQQAGSPANGWEFRPGTSYGRVIVKRSTGGVNLPSFPTTTRDAAVTLKLYHIGVAGGPGYASGFGVLNIVFRATFDDYFSGDMTYIDFPAGFGFQLTGSGSISMTRKLGDYLVQDINQPRFPDCTNLEVVSVTITDPNGNVFATPGVEFQ